MLPLCEGTLELPSDPIAGVETWLVEAQRAGLPEPTSMNLATVTAEGRPQSRIVLLKGITTSPAGFRGFEFFTNYQSPKSKQLLLTPYASINFHWVAMRRQVRIDGVIEKLTAAESDRYFQSRPRESRVGAWSSPQSQVIVDRAHLERLVQESQARFGDSGPVPCPPFWGGWRLVPDRIEFWEERPFRLHERFEFCLNEAEQWTKSRLAP